MAIKSLKSLIDQYFDERVQVSERGYHCYDSFLRTHENLMQEIKDYGIDGVFPQWYDYIPSCWDRHLIPAINKFVSKVLEPQYRKWSTITK